MKIDLDKVDRTQFMVHEHSLNGEIVHLIQPQHIGTQWRQDNKHLRSVVVNYEGEIISAGLPKFTNYSENPEHFPVPTSLRNCTVVNKLDGSLLIVSKYKNQFILRTRGTVDASVLANGSELEIFKNTILKKISVDQMETWNYSLLFEWLSPLNVIVLRYSDEPDWQLIGAVNHTDYSLFSQTEVDEYAKMFDLKRPEKFTFNDISDMLQIVDKWQDREGVCLYSKNDQVIHKIKSAIYLIKHRFKSEATLENTLDLYFSYGKPSYQEFESKLTETFDYECFEMVRGYASQICDASKEVNKIIDGFKSFIDNQLKVLPTRKEQAQLVISSYGETNRAAFVFKLLDNRPLGKEEYKKLLFQVLKNY